MKKIDEVVNAYVACGNAVGYFYAECILMKHLPKNKPDGKCFNVPAKNRPAFLVDLKNAAEHGVQLTDDGLRILDGVSHPPSSSTNASSLGHKGA